MPSNVIQFDSLDGCTYLFDLDKKKWMKICEVQSLPSDVRKKAFAYLENAEDIAGKAKTLKESL